MPTVLADEASAAAAGLGLTVAELAVIAGISPSAMSGWFQGNAGLSRAALKRTEQLVEVWRAAELVLRPEAVRDWLLAPVPLLGNARPADCIRDGRAAEVLDVIRALGEGVFV